MPTNQKMKKDLVNRGRLVTASFVLSMAIGGFLLNLGSPDKGPDGFLLTNLRPIDDNPKDPLFVTNRLIKDNMWTDLVITHHGQARGTIESIDHSHSQEGLGGLAWHFVVGNGNGIEDGVVFCGDRWIEQRLGSIKINSSAEGVLVIGLVGDGDKRRFTPRQIDSLVTLVHRLQAKLAIPASRIHLHTDLEPTTAPGQYFVAGTFASQLIEKP